MDFEKRSLQRKENNTPEDKAELLANRIRTGELTKEKILIAAVLGDKVAQGVVGQEKYEYSNPKDLLEKMFTIDVNLTRKFALEYCKFLAPANVNEKVQHIINFLETILDSQQELTKEQIEDLERAKNFISAIEDTIVFSADPNDTHKDYIGAIESMVIAEMRFASNMKQGEDDQDKQWLEMAADSYGLVFSSAKKIKNRSFVYHLDDYVNNHFIPFLMKE